MHQSRCVCWCCPDTACCVAPSVQGHPTAQTPSPMGWADTDWEWRWSKVTLSTFLRTTPSQHSHCRYYTTIGPCSKTKGAGDPFPTITSGCICTGSPWSRSSAGATAFRGAQGTHTPLRAVRATRMQCSRESQHIQPLVSSLVGS